ncbi:hypothetical protein PoB_006267200 [Plakobranchus ocellatus]|uniref:Uncharacterized protein n=1 Tax=Plakobranchus ocellatus TaxID=259542 RepID=A0AAV4CW82_9GAST|nr:hypothetical protein PoB_006267200 [Plakobranchus ocellatus]
MSLLFTVLVEYEKGKEISHSSRKSIVSEGSQTSPTTPSRGSGEMEPEPRGKSAEEEPPNDLPESLPEEDPRIVSVNTNDAVTGRRILDHRPLPYGAFKTVSLLLESPGWAAKDITVNMAPHDMPPLATRLQPYTPFDKSRRPLISATKPQSGDIRASAEEEEVVRLPPVQFRPSVDKDVKGPMAEPFHHPGIAWPLAVSGFFTWTHVLVSKL